jgi:uncharacterized ferritin-like protein (DUF455 family)
LLRRLVQVWRDVGDDETADILAGILADEIQHVRFANLWFQRMSKADKRVLLQLAAGVDFLKRVTTALAPEDGETNAAGVELTAFDHSEVLANIDDRRRAGFSDREIDRIVRQEEAAAGQTVGIATGGPSPRDPD